MRCYSVEDNMLDLMWSKYGNEDTIHMHATFELIYIVKGRGVQIINGKQVEFREKQALLLEPNSTHSYTFYENTEHFSVLIGKSFISNGINEFNNNDDLLSYLNPNDRSGVNAADFSDESDMIENIFFEMIEEQRVQNKGWINKERAYVTILLVEFLRKAVSLQSCKINMSYVIDDVQRYVNENYSSSITLKQISEFYHVCPEYISSLMKKKVGLTFKEYLIRDKWEPVRKSL